MLHKSDSYAVNGNVKGVNRMHIISSLSWPIFMAVLMAGSFYVGGPTVQAILEMIPDFVNDGLSVATGILPALGFALLASMLINKKSSTILFIRFCSIGLFGNADSRNYINWNYYCNVDDYTRTNKRKYCY